MTDRLHDHLTLGVRRGCVACAQVEADLAMSRKWLLAHGAVLSDGVYCETPKGAG